MRRIVETAIVSFAVSVTVALVVERWREARARSLLPQSPVSGQDQT